MAAGDRAHRREAWTNQLDDALARVPEVVPFSIAIFGGVVDPTKLRFPLSRMPATDARDWDAIRDWANTVAEEFQRAAPG